MDTYELTLMNQWVQHRDPEAFNTLAKRHMAMVFHTCRRILGDALEAEDVTQECFEALAQTQKPPQSNVAAWLHRVATHKAINRIKAEGRRRAREQAFAASLPDSDAIPWADVYAALDEVLATLPDNLKTPLILHFYEGQTHEQIAQADNLSRSTVSKRITKGVELLRKRMMQRGIPVAGTAMLMALERQAAHAATVPQGVAQGLSKIALAGLQSPVSTGMAVGLTGLLGSKVLMGLVSLLMVAGAGMMVAHGFSSASNDNAPPPVTPGVVATTEQEDTFAAEAVEPSVVEATTESSIATPVVLASTSVEEDSAPSIDGQWRMFIKQGNGAYEEAEPATISRRGASITFKHEEGQDSGAIEGHVVKIIPEVVGSMMTGRFNDAWDTLELTGIYRETQHTDGVEDVVDVPLSIKFTRTTPEYVAGKNLEQDLQQMYVVLKAYADGHQGRFPPQLNALIPEYQQDLSLFANTKDRQVDYFPDAGHLNTGEAPKREEYLAGVDTENIRGALLAWEEALKQYWGGSLLFPKTLVKITLHDSEAVYTLDVQGNILPPDQQEPVDSSQARASCANNLKQLGLVCKMFANECKGWHYPPGWRSTIPEYLTDTGILTCPAEAPHSDSYQILFPAINQVDAQYIYESVMGKSESSSSSFGGGLPVLVEQHKHKGLWSTGRNVLFWDGHVECLDAKVWEEKVAPFLKFKL